MSSDPRIKKALDLIGKSTANYEFFFDTLSSPEWLEPLKTAGFFKDPPNAIREPNSVSFPRWVESRYLARIASLAPGVVRQLIEAMPPTDNVRVHEDFVDAAVAMPLEDAERIASREQAWLVKQDQIFGLLDQKVVALVERLSEGGKTAAGLGLLKALLATKCIGTEPRARIDTWSYQQALAKAAPALVRSEPLRALGGLYDLLDDVLRCAGATELEDMSWIWRPAIEDHTQNTEMDLRDALVRGIRDAVELVAAESLATVREVVDGLRSKRFPIFRRLALHVLALAADSASASAVAEAMNRENFLNRGVHHEYSVLLRRVFPLLSAEQANEVLGWIDTEGADDPDRSLDAREYKRLRRLAALGDSLPAAAAAERARLAEKLGEPEFPDFVSYHVEWRGSLSPASRDELLRMPGEELVKFLSTWEAKGGWREPDEEGLSQELQHAVQTEPERFAALLPAFRTLRAVFVAASLQGLASVTRAGGPINWERVLEFADWVTSPRPTPARTIPEDTHWHWARKVVADLLDIGLEKDHVPFALGDAAWTTLTRLVEDPDPPKDGTTDKLDPAFEALNSVRGMAMSAVIKYGLWALRNAPADTDTNPYTSRALSVVESHLIRENDASPAVRCVFGQYFPAFVVMNVDWARSNWPGVFGTEYGDALGAAAWAGYLGFSGVFDNVFPILRARYIAHASAVDVSEPHEDALHRRLAEHLMLMVVRGKESLATEGPVEVLFANGPDRYRAHGIAFVGRLLRNEKVRDVATVTARLVDFWEALVARMKGNEVSFPKTHSAFGWWFSSGVFNERWALDQLVRVAAATGDLDLPRDVVERLEQAAQLDPAATLSVFTRIVENDKIGWGLLEWGDAARKVLQALLVQPSVASETKALIHRLGARGHEKFRDLVG